MFNEYIKQKFVDENKSSFAIRTCSHICFNTSERYEQIFAKDLYDFDLDEITILVKELLEGKLTNARYNYIFILQKYNKWAVNKGYTEHLFDYNLQDIPVSNITLWVDSAELLKMRIDKVFLPNDMMTADIPKKAFLWMAYMGIGSADISNVKDKDIDLENNLIYVEDKIYPIPEEGICDIKACLEASGYCKVNQIGGLNPLREKVSGEYFLRTDRISKPNFKIYKDAIRGKCENRNVKFKLGHRNIFESGSFARTYVKELRTGIVDVSECCKERGNAYFSESIQVRRNTVRSAISDYEIWKQTFNYK